MSKKEKILITGGAGFIGSHLVDEIIKKDYEVVVVDDLSTGRLDRLDSRARFYQMDINQLELMTIFERERPDYVIHAAAQTRVRISVVDPLFDARVNILGTINILESCKEYGVKKVIYTSTGGARYGEPDFLPVNEDGPLQPLSPYGISKHTAEHYLAAYNRLYGLDYLIFCFGNVYGPRDNLATQRVIPAFIRQMLDGQSPTIFGDGEQIRDFIYVLDLAHFLVGCLNKNTKSKIFNLSNNEKSSVNEIFDLIKKLLGFKGEAIHQSPINGEVKNIILDTARAQSELGWQPVTSLEDGLRKTIEWFKIN